MPVFLIALSEPDEEVWIDVSREEKFPAEDFWEVNNSVAFVRTRAPNAEPQKIAENLGIEVEVEPGKASRKTAGIVVDVSNASSSHFGRGAVKEA